MYRCKCNKKNYIYWVVPPPSSSHHQDYCIFNRESQPFNLHLPLWSLASWEGGQPNIYIYTHTFIPYMEHLLPPTKKSPWLFFDKSRHMYQSPRRCRQQMSAFRPEKGSNEVLYMDVEPKMGGCLPPKMDGLFHGSNPMNKWMIWGFSHIFGNTHICKGSNGNQ